MKGGEVPNLRSTLDEVLYELTMVHLTKLEEYVPGPVKKAGGAKADLITRYKADPVFSIWGLDSVEYAAATLGGGTITSIHRKLGDIYQDSVKSIFMTTLGQTPEQVGYSAVIVSGTAQETRTADSYLQFDRLDSAARKRISKWCKGELRKLTAKPKLKLVGVGMEIRHCYQTGDSKRTQADEAMARHLLVSGILPVMPLFCNQSNPTVIERYRSVWIVKQGMESYDMLRLFSDYDYFDFLKTESGRVSPTDREDASEPYGMMQATLFERTPSFRNRPTDSVTFKGKLTLPIHRWYRLTPSFSPQLAHDIADHFKLTADDLVLDPFSGVGTVPLCMKYRGLPAWSVELNPYLHFVGTVKTRTYADVEAIEGTFREFMGTFERESNRDCRSTTGRWLICMRTLLFFRSSTSPNDGGRAET